MIFTILVGLFIVFISTSYALWTVNVEKNNNLNIVVGVLNYELTSPELNGNNQVVVPANSEKRINITLKSLNAIDSDYSVYYQGSLPSGVTIMYDGINSLPADNISITGVIKHIGIIIRNNSSSNYTATLGVKGGLTNKGLALDSNTYQITNTYSFSKDYAYTGNYQTFTALASGYYNMEAWGAEGGYGSTTHVNYQNTSSGIFKGGRGSYTSGVIYLNAGESIYIYVGGKGTDHQKNYNETVSGGYNGGGRGGHDTNNVDTFGGGGGGSTDFRLNLGTWNDTTSLRSRIMVSAGGGGGAVVGADYAYNDNQRALHGTNGGNLNNNYLYINHYGLSLTNLGANQNSGTFGYGMDGYNGDQASGGGGSGYYGGKSLQSKTGGSSGGGSSYISGYGGVNAINSSGSHTNNTLHYSGKYFVKGNIDGGVNEGNGRAKITFIASQYSKTNSKLNSVRYIKDCTNGSSYDGKNHWVELQAIKNGVNMAKDKSVTATAPFTNVSVATDGIIESSPYSEIGQGRQCITVDLGTTYDLDEVSVWHYYWDNREYAGHTLDVSSNNSDWTNVIMGSCNSANGIRTNAWEENYYFVGSPQIFTASLTGNYNIQAWGAEGGDANAGVKGGYTSGNIYLNKGEVLYLYVGEYPRDNVNKEPFNGGGTANSDGRYRSGGGATDIRLSNGTWNDTTGLRSRIMVAGGGGGSFNNGSIYIPGGAGGGLTGENGYKQGNSPSINLLVEAKGGTQISGGAGGIGTNTSGSAGYFGKGANGGTFLSAGGGGYYGGGSSGVNNDCAGSGGGGSSFISGFTGVNAINAAGNHTNSIFHYSGKYFTNGKMQAGVNLSSGKVKITYINLSSGINYKQRKTKLR